MPSKARPVKQLTEQHKLFCRKFVGDAKFNATEAARASGYKVSTCKSHSSWLLRDPLIQAELATLAKPHLKKAELSIESVLAELSGIVHLSISDYFDEHGSLIPLAELSEPSKRAIKSMDVRVTSNGDQIVRLQWYDKVKGIQLAMTKLGLFQEQIDPADQVKIVLVPLDEYERGEKAIEGTNDITMVDLAPL